MFTPTFPVAYDVTGCAARRRSQRRERRHRDAKRSPNPADAAMPSDERSCGREHARVRVALQELQPGRFVNRMSFADRFLRFSSVSVLFASDATVTDLFRPGEPGDAT